MKNNIEQIVQKAIDEKRICIPARSNISDTNSQEYILNALITTQTAILKELVAIREIAKEEQDWRILTEGMTIKT